eukprot:14857667-Alexandrium_andersonii.AAC.1
MPVRTHMRDLGAHMNVAQVACSGTIKKRLLEGVRTLGRLKNMASSFPNRVGLCSERRLPSGEPGVSPPRSERPCR